MRRLLFAVPVLLLNAHATLAATEADCLAQWKSADADGNGALSRSEDKSGIFAAIQKSGRPLLTPDTVSRDEFVTHCTGGVVGTGTAGSPAVATSGPAANKDLGKGDLTPGAKPLAREDALKKLAASGFKDVEGLALDNTGIWRGTAVASGKRVQIAVDPQGDIVAR